MSKKQATLVHKICVHNIQLDQTQPTTFSFAQLYDWVIWQYPQQIEQGLTGAVRPPLAHENWYPAIIEPKKKRVQVYGHLDTLYNTPEEAAKQVSAVN